MLLIGLILFFIGLFAHIGIAFNIGCILLIIGGIIWVLGALGMLPGPRSHYW